MEERRRSRRDFLQNIVITLLLLSSVCLFTATQRSTLEHDGGLLRLFSEGAAQSGDTAPTPSPAASFPVRVAVTGAFGRYGSIALTSGDDDAEALTRLLRSALSSAQSFSACTGQSFLFALRDTSVYFDFLAPLPLPVIAEMTGCTLRSDASARHLILSVRDDTVYLHIWDHGSRYLSAATTLSGDEVEQTVSRYELGSAQFALDLAESNTDARSIDPCSLFLTETPSLSVLTASASAADSSHLLTALGFNPNTKFRYTESTGTEVIEENSRTLRIRTDGRIHYQSGGSDALSIASAAQHPTITELVSGAGALLRSILGTSAGEAALYVQQIQQTEQTVLITFGYHVGGIPICFSDGSSAASVTLSGGVVTDLTLQLRQYHESGTPSLLLPLPQALSIACRQVGSELFIGYTDLGGDTVQAAWLMA